MIFTVGKCLIKIGILRYWIKTQKKSQSYTHFMTMYLHLWHPYLSCIWVFIFYVRRRESFKGLLLILYSLYWILKSLESSVTFHIVENMSFDVVKVLDCMFTRPNQTFQFTPNKKIRHFVYILHLSFFLFLSQCSRPISVDRLHVPAYPFMNLYPDILCDPTLKLVLR